MCNYILNGKKCLNEGLIQCSSCLKYFCGDHIHISEHICKLEKENTNNDKTLSIEDGIEKIIKKRKTENSDFVSQGNNNNNNNVNYNNNNSYYSDNNNNVSYNNCNTYDVPIRINNGNALSSINTNEFSVGVVTWNYNHFSDKYLEPSALYSSFIQPILPEGYDALKGTFPDVFVRLSDNKRKLYNNNKPLVITFTEATQLPPDWFFPIIDFDYLKKTCNEIQLQFTDIWSISKVNRPGN